MDHLTFGNDPKVVEEAVCAARTAETAKAQS